jgi:hypothetical protein
MKGADSLEQTMREEGDSTSLPVITVGNTGRLEESAYIAACATRLVEIILDLDIYMLSHRARDAASLCCSQDVGDDLRTRFVGDDLNLDLLAVEPLGRFVM